MPCMGAKRRSYIENYATPRKGVYFLVPRDHRKGDLIAIWEQFSPYGSISDNPIRKYHFINKLKDKQNWLKS